MRRRPPRSTLVPYATLFRSGDATGNQLLGDAGHDVLAGGDGADTLDGGTGFDRFDAGTGDDVLVAGASRTEPSLADSFADRKSTPLNSSPAHISSAVFRFL